MIDTELSGNIQSDSLHFFGSVLTENSGLLVMSAEFVDRTQRLIVDVGAVSLGVMEHSFSENPEDQSGFTVVFLLAESHIAVHTWPEYGVAELDVYLCNYLRDNRKKCEDLFDGMTLFFDPISISKQRVSRPRAEGLSTR